MNDDNQITEIADISLRKVPIPILLAFISASSYLIAYNFEKGFFEAFGIPPDLIDIQLNVLLIFAAISLGIITALFPLISIFVMILNNVFKPALARALAPILILVIPTLFLLYLQIPNFRWGWLLFVLFAFMIFLQLLFPLITQSKVKGYYNKLLAQEEHEAQIKSLPDIIRVRSGKDILILFGLLLMTTSLAWFVGQSEALHKTSYLTLESDPRLLLVRSYPNRFLFVQYDDQTRSVLQKFEIIPQDSGRIGLSSREFTSSPLITSATPTPEPSPTSVISEPTEQRAKESVPTSASDNQ